MVYVTPSVTVVVVAEPIDTKIKFNNIEPKNVENFELFRSLPGIIVAVVGSSNYATAN